MRSWIRAFELRRLAGSAEGRAHLLNLAIDAEQGDEAGIFDQLCEQMDDPELQRLVRRHRDDEVRHAAMFQACLDRTGLQRAPVPEPLRLIRRIGGDVPSEIAAVRTRADVVRTYALLLAIELRGVQQFPLHAAAFRKHDPRTADVYLAVMKDEQRHVRYCQAIGPRYAAHEREWPIAVREAHALEHTAFHQVSRAGLAYSLRRGLFRLGALTPAGRLAARALERQTH